MLIAYLSTDEVNQHLAVQVAEQFGETLCLVSPRDALPDEDFDVVAYDWDCLPAQRQQTILAELQARRPPRPVALHSYNLEEACVEALSRQGVAVYRKLHPAMFWLLAIENSYRRATQASGSVEENDDHFEERLLARLRDTKLGDPI
jgi:hypothetical protein